MGPRKEGRLRVLVVDDLPDAADSLCMLVELWGQEAVAAYSGAGALAALGPAAPDVALLDLAMPGLEDGLELARRIRASPGGTGTLLVAISGHGRDQEVQAALAAGFDRHLTKPVEPERLRCLLEEYAAGGVPP